MNPDYYSQVKLAQRFFLQKSIYLLNMFDKKVQSFFSNRSRQAREREKQELLHQNNIINFSNQHEDPLKALAKDFTKPVWNCLTQTHPTAVVALNNHSADYPTQHNNSNHNHSNRLSSFTGIGEMLIRFLQRFGCEHQDQSGLRMQIKIIDKSIKNQQNDLSKASTAMKELFDFMLKINKRQQNMLNQERDKMNFQDQHGWAGLQNQAEAAILHAFVGRPGEQNNQIEHTQESSFRQQLLDFVCKLGQLLRQVIECQRGPTLINYWPQVGMLSQLVHPVILTIYAIVKEQTGNHSQPAHSSSDNLMESRTNIQQEQSDTIFDQLRTATCSKITFINLDGYQSKSNLVLAKYLGKYVQYVSFPTEVDPADPHYAQVQIQHSQQLLKEYLMGALSPQQLQNSYRTYKLAQKKQLLLSEYYKGLIVLPVHSLALTRNHNLPNISYFQSYLVAFLMRELVYNQIKQFGPSVIVVSTSNRLNLINSHFEQIMRQLTVISNMKVVMYNNLNKTYVYEHYQPIAQPIKQLSQSNHNALLQFYRVEKQIQIRQQLSLRPYRIRSNSLYSNQGNCQLNQSSAQLIETSLQLNYEMLDRQAIFLKVSSGTYSLNKQQEQDCKMQKYANFKIMKYVSGLLGVLADKHPALHRYKNKSKEYHKISRILECFYRDEFNHEIRGIYKQTPAYYQQLLTQAESIIKQAIQTEQSNQNYINSSADSRFRWLGQYICSVYGGSEQIKEQWNNYVHFKQLQIQKEKQLQDCKYLTRLPRYKPNEDQQANANNFIAVQFELTYQGNTSTVRLNLSRSQVCHSAHRHSQLTHFFIFNHLAHPLLPSLHNFWGILDPNIQISSEGRVVLNQLTIKQNRYDLNVFEHFTQFNYHQTSTSVICYWPTLYDQLQATLHHFAQRTYHPIITNLIFVANKQSPHVLQAVQPQNQLYRWVIPRSNCTSYQVPGTSHIYVFGGFYAQEKQYLCFQKDINLFKYTQNGILQAETVPKQFHFDYQTIEQQSNSQSLQDLTNQMPSNANSLYAKDVYQITKLKNDLVRPRAYYQIIELPTKKSEFQNQQTQKSNSIQSATDQYVQILLCGGVGRKFMQPFSLLGYMGHRIVFSPQGLIQRVRRVRLNNIVPTNLPCVVRTKTAMQLPTLQHAQNRRIYAQQQNQPEGTPTYSWYKLSYNQQEERVEYKKEYEYAVARDGEVEQQQQEHVIVAKDSRVKVVLRHLQGHRQNDSLLLACTDQGTAVRLGLNYTLSQQVYNQFPNLAQRTVALTADSIASVTISGLQVYVLINHPEYSFGRHILTHCDLTATIQASIDIQIGTIQVKQIYQFDGQLNQQILLVLSQQRILLIHGLHIYPQHKHRQSLLIKTPQGPFIHRSIVLNQSSYQQCRHVLAQLPPLPQANNISFYALIKDVVYCWTFVSMARTCSSEELVLFVEELDTHEEQLAWSMAQIKRVVLEIDNAQKNNEQIENGNNYGSLQIVDMLATGGKYQLFVANRNQVYSGSVQLLSQGESQVVRLGQPRGSLSSHFQMNYSMTNYSNYFLTKMFKPRYAYTASIMQAQIH